MAKDIPRATLRQLVRDYKANGLFQPNHAGVVAYPDTLLVYNSTGTAIPVGGPIKISGYPATTSFTAALNKMINGELVLNGVASGSGDDSSGIVTALVPILSGKIGRVQNSGIVFARVHYNAPASGDNEYSQASATFELVKKGVFQIVASSQKDAGNYMICAMNRLAGGGGRPTFTSVINSVAIGFKLNNTAAQSLNAVTDLNVVNGELVIGSGVVTLDLTKGTISVVKSLS